MNNAPKSNSILAFSQITKSYPQTQTQNINVLKGVSGCIQSGEVVALVAPSGAGKSTLLHLLALLDTPDDGTLWINGEKVQTYDDKTRSHLRCASIGFVYQAHHLLPEFSALENIMLPQFAIGRPRSSARKRAMTLLAQVGLENRADHRPAMLSGGEQQRVALCRALANDPTILLADEPTGNLDTQTAEMVFEVLLGLMRATGLCALIATHNIELAQRMDRIWHLKDGTFQHDP